VIAEEARETVDHDNIEGRGLGRSRLDHALKLGAAVVGSRRSGFDEGLDKLIAPRFAPGFACRFWSGIDTSCSACRLVETRR
jgi:hypothetical protein